MITGIVWNTEPVMARYRELKGQGLDGLAASRVVLQEFTGATHVETPGIQPMQHTDNATRLCNTCRQPMTGRGKVCSTCRSKAYRGRRG